MGDKHRYLCLGRSRELSWLVHPLRGVPDPRGIWATRRTGMSLRLGEGVHLACVSCPVGRL